MFWFLSCCLLQIHKLCCCLAPPMPRSCMFVIRITYNYQLCGRILAICSCSLWWSIWQSFCRLQELLSLSFILSSNQLSPELFTEQVKGWNASGYYGLEIYPCSIEGVPSWTGGYYGKSEAFFLSYFVEILSKFYFNLCFVLKYLLPATSFLWGATLCWLSRSVFFFYGATWQSWKFFSMRVLGLSNRLPREIVDTSSLWVFKARLDEAWSSWV